MSWDNFLALRHEAGRAKWRKELFREQPPPFLGDLVSVREVMERTKRSRTWVQNRIAEGSLNFWKDPTTKRVWILKDDLDIVAGVWERKEADKETRRRETADKETGRQGDKEKRRAEAGEEEDESEDLDAIGGWEHPKPPPVVPGAGMDEAILESNLRYEQKVRENEEWYAAELAKLEDRDPEEAVRQLQVERGWVEAEEPEVRPESFDSVYEAAKALSGDRTERRTGKGRRTKADVRPVSLSGPGVRAEVVVEPYVDPESDTGPQVAVVCPFPMGWVGWRAAAGMLQVSKGTLNQLALDGKIGRRKSEDGRNVWLYDSVELERVGEARLEKRCTVAAPGKRLDWWGSRRVKAELNEYDGWLTAAEAGRILGVSAARVGRMCDKGMLPCYQEQPGVQGSKLMVPYFHVLRIADRPERKEQKKRWEESRKRSAAWVEHEEWGIEEHDPRGESRAMRKSHGEYLSTKQAALMLGVSVSSVHNLRLRGRLTGVHLRAKKAGSAKGPWWFFRRDEVEGLLADGAYRRNSAKGKRIQSMTG